MTDTCAAEDCDRPTLARGLCSRHYQQAKAAGRLDEVAPNPSTICEHCGEPIPKGRRWGARYCSTDCKYKAVDAARHAALVQQRAAQPRFCAWCREPLGAGRRYGTRFCSAKCSDDWNNNQKRLAMLRAKKAARRRCQVCQKPIPATRGSNSIYCSYECKKLGIRSGSPRARRNQMDHNRQYLYGITIEEFEARLASQGNRCAICRTEEWSGKGPHVDHDHATGHVRGVLCHKCNLGLGKFNDDPELLRAAIRYLEGASVPS
jgi:predicted nucleic acid-binding Zn ribbon protein